MNNKLILLLILIITANICYAQTNSSNRILYNTSDVSSILVYQTLAAIGGGVLGISGGVAIGFNIGQGLPTINHAIVACIITTGILYPITASLSVFLIGELNNYHSSFITTMAGAFIGYGVSTLVYFSLTGFKLYDSTSYVYIIPLLTFTIIGAIIGYDISINKPQGSVINVSTNNISISFPNIKIENDGKYCMEIFKYEY